jgi:hypothetical protein
MRYWWSGNSVWEPLYCIARQSWQVDFSSHFSANLISFAYLLVDLALAFDIRINAVQIRKSLEWVLRISKLITRELDATAFLWANILHRVEAESITLRGKSQKFDFERYLNMCLAWLWERKGHSRRDVHCIECSKGIHTRPHQSNPWNLKAVHSFKRYAYSPWDSIILCKRTIQARIAPTNWVGSIEPRISHTFSCDSSNERPWHVSRRCFPVSKR